MSGSNRNITFDTDLPCRHEYLGIGMSELSGRALLVETTQELPLLLAPAGTPLVPGQTLPLTEFSEARKRTLRYARRCAGGNGRALGFVVRCSDNEKFSIELPSSGGRRVYQMGTVAELLSVHDTENDDDERASGCVKAIVVGRQRMSLRRLRTTVDGILLADVELLVDRTPTHSLSELVPRSALRLLVPPSLLRTADIDQNRRALAKLERRRRWLAAAVSTVPPFLHRLADCRLLARQLRQEMQRWLPPQCTESAFDTSVESANPNLSNHAMIVASPNVEGVHLNNQFFNKKEIDLLFGGAVPAVQNVDPLSTSYWALQQLPMSGARRQSLLRLEHPLWRLQAELGFVRQCQALCCLQCSADIAHPNEVLALASDGASNAFVNPQGAVHEMLTVCKARNSSCVGRRTTEHSWFPGYAWRILLCSRCGAHLGWHFTAEVKSLRPLEFWGLCRAALRCGFLARNGRELAWHMYLDVPLTPADNRAESRQRSAIVTGLMAVGQVLRLRQPRPNDLPEPMSDDDEEEVSEAEEDAVGFADDFGLD